MTPFRLPTALSEPVVHYETVIAGFGVWIRALHCLASAIHAVIQMLRQRGRDSLT